MILHRGIQKSKKLRKKIGVSCTLKHVWWCGAYSAEIYRIKFNVFSHRSKYETNPKLIFQIWSAYWWCSSIIEEQFGMGRNAWRMGVFYIERGSGELYFPIAELLHPRQFGVSVEINFPGTRRIDIPDRRREYCSSKNNNIEPLIVFLHCCWAAHIVYWIF